MPEAYIRGNTIKYLRVPDEVIDKVREDSYNRAGIAAAAPAVECRLSTYSTALTLSQHSLDDSVLAMMPPAAVTLAQCSTDICTGCPDK